MRREEREYSPSRKRSMGLLGWLVSFLLRIVLLVLVAAVLLYFLPVSLFLFETDEELSPSPDLGGGVLNVLLLGIDAKAQSSQRSDSIIIASIGHNRLCLTSVMRDTVVEIPGHGQKKLNSAYQYGGAELVMRTLNENFSLNITKYVCADFIALAEVLNAMGGVDLSITRQEQEQINENLKSSWRKVFAPAGYPTTASSILDLDFSGADEKGYLTAHLDGFQALNYARIRKLGNDYARTERQRKLLGAALSQLLHQWYRPQVLVRVVREGFRRADTNLNWLEITSLGLKAAFGTRAESLRLPVDGTFTDDGSALRNVNYAANLEAFKQAVYR